ncbi:MAG: hypothetical protein WC582_03185 [Patescibacteria group bacterium]|jgi:hypothetical protein
MFRNIINNFKTHVHCSDKQRTISSDKNWEIVGSHKAKAAQEVSAGVGNALRRLSDD